MPDDREMLPAPKATTASGRRLIVITGGARSGKSRYAEALAARLAQGRPVLYVATAVPSDPEMRARIAAHRASRPAGWLTVEAPLDPGTAITASEATGSAGLVLVDCVTLLVANIVLAEEGESEHVETLDAQAVTAVERRAGVAVEGLLSAFHAGSASFVVVTNEVGMGLVPPYPLGRLYRDLLGRINARLVQEADVVLLLIAGLPIELKALAQAWQDRAPEALGLSVPFGPFNDANADGTST